MYLLLNMCCAHACDAAIPMRQRAARKIERIVKRLRAPWPEAKILLRGDAGFCRDELMTWREANQVDYVLGLARNVLLEAIVAPTLAQAKRQWQETQKPARVFLEFQDSASAWREETGDVHLPRLCSLLWPESAGSVRDLASDGQRAHAGNAEANQAEVAPPDQTGLGYGAFCRASIKTMPCLEISGP